LISGAAISGLRKKERKIQTTKMVRSRRAERKIGPGIQGPREPGVTAQTAQIKVDLISDTQTRPTPAMWEAMRNAELGDEQKGEDPTVLRLERRVASLLGQESALFVPTATAANQVALLLHCGPGDEVLCDRTSHIFNYETGFGAVLARAQLHPLDGPRGVFSAEDVAARIRHEDPHLPVTSAVVVENTSNGGGGTVWAEAEFNAVADLCDQIDIALHIDGARLMNASVATGLPPSTWGSRATTVQMCFSKGLGCPFGAVLAMPQSLWPQARRFKQGMGAALRQAGVVASAMLHALDHHVERLAEDHRRASILGEALAAFDGVEVAPIPTNLVFFKLAADRPDPSEFCASLLKKGVRMAPALGGRVRACFHLGVDDAALDFALNALRLVLR
jgi:threonine aldolase